MYEPKVLVFDIETSPITAYVWGRHDQNVGLNQIKKDWSVIAWAAKWLGEKEVMYRDNRSKKNISDDKDLLQPLLDLLDQADIVITQNGKSFDSRKLNARFIMNGMKPPSPYEHLDTYRIARQVGDFTANSLEYLTDKLCTKYKKLSHSKFPGMTLWNECLSGNKEAWEEMKKYNIHDVLATEELYEKLKAWTPQAMPRVYRASSTGTTCQVCGKDSLRRRGKLVNKSGLFQRWQCRDCGTWSKGAKVNG